MLVDNLPGRFRCLRVHVKEEGADVKTCIRTRKRGTAAMQMEIFRKTDLEKPDLSA